MSNWGRPPKEIDKELMLDLLSQGLSKKEVAGVLAISLPTLDRKIADLKKAESNLLAYDKVAYLDIIGVQQRLVGGITDEKIADAPLGQIAQAYGVFNKASQLIQGKPTEIHGLMGYLLHLEKEDIEAVMSKNDAPEEAEQLSLFGDTIDIGD